MTTIGSFSKPEEANLLRCRLEAMGIPAFVRDELTIQMYWLYSNALGGVRVEVPDRYADLAHEIIGLPPVEASVDLACPQCGAINVVRQEWPRRLAYLSLLLASFPLLLSGKRFKCPSCHFTWR